MRYYTYIIFSKLTSKFYTGITSNIENRIIEHQMGKCSSTKKGVPWEIIYTENFENRIDAAQLEKKIKKRGAKRFLVDRGVDTHFAC